MRGVVPRGSHDSATGMATRATQEQARNWRAVLSGLISWSHHQQLVHRKFGMVPMATGYTIVLFEVGWRQEFLMNNLLANSRCVLRDRIDSPFANLVASSVGPAAFQFVRDVHDVSGQYVLSVWSFICTST